MRPARTLSIFRDDDVDVDWQGTIHVKPAFHTVWDHNIPFPLPSEAFCPAGMDATKMDKMLINAFKMLEEKGQHVLNTVANCIDDFQVGVVQE